jgi:hypothetical protein
MQRQPATMWALPVCPDELAPLPATQECHLTMRQLAYKLVRPTVYVISSTVPLRLPGTAEPASQPMSVELAWAVHSPPPRTPDQSLDSLFSPPINADQQPCHGLTGSSVHDDTRDDGHSDLATDLRWRSGDASRVELGPSLTEQSHGEGGDPSRVAFLPSAGPLPTADLGMRRRACRDRRMTARHRVRLTRSQGGQQVSSRDCWEIRGLW